MRRSLRVSGRLLEAATLAGFLVLLLLFACDRHGLATTTPNGSQLELPTGVRPIAFAPGEVHIQSAFGVHSLRVEVAGTWEQIERGLMYRTSLPEDAGMLFVYPRAHQGSFWMFNTFIPLSIAYADESGVIFQISDMVPCGNLPESECTGQATPALQPFRFALEANQGYFARRGIKVGDRIRYVLE